jgi:peptide/nickel transport system permease protein
VSPAIGLLSALLSVLLGTTLGALAGFFRGASDAVLMRATDALLAIPRLPFLMILGAILARCPDVDPARRRPAGWRPRDPRRPSRCRAGPYVEAARSRRSRPAILVRHLLPNVAATVSVAAPRRGGAS